MAAGNDESIPIFTINDFPTELIVRFAPDLRPRTVSTLRLVSRRFRDVFSADRYYRSYLCYTDKLNMYQHDLEEIGDQEGKWKLLLEAEKRRLGNWREGRPARVDTVEIPNDLVSAYANFRWQGETGDGNEHWMLSECRDQKIVLLNVTKAPILTVVDVSSYTSLSRNFALLLPDQVLIDSGTDSRRVFNILNDGANLSLEHLFTIEAESGYDSMSISGHSKVIRSYRSLYVNYKYVSTNAVLTVWDLKRAVKLESIVLRELLSPMCAFDLDQISYLSVRPTGYPYVVAELENVYDDPLEMYGRMAVVNLEERRLAFWSGEVTCYDSNECNVDGNYLCLVVNCHQSRCKVVRVYDLRLRRTIEFDESGLIFQHNAGGTVEICNVNPLKLVFTEENKTELVSIDPRRLEGSQREINVRVYGKEDKVCYVFGPFLIVYRFNILSAVDMSGDVMFHWGDLFPEEHNLNFHVRFSFVRNLDFHSLNKCVLKYITTKRNVVNYLKICYF